jgi:hypothetical protein
MVVDISVQCYWIPNTKISLAIKCKICIHQDLSWEWSYGSWHFSAVLLDTQHQSKSSDQMQNMYTPRSVMGVVIRDVNRFWSSRRKLKSSRLGDLYGRGSGINGAKSCILGLSWHLISLLKLHFFVLVSAGRRHTNGYELCPSSSRFIFILIWVGVSSKACKR